MINQKFAYRPLQRTTLPDGSRFYLCPETGKQLPSVTTILSATSDKKELEEWRENIGTEKADRIRDEACALGSLMHNHLENHLLETTRPRGNNLIRILASNMSDVIINQGLCYVEEVWGCEVALYAPTLYAGTTDLIGSYKGVPAILDYKTCRKMKPRSCKIVQDYASQAAAYGVCHDYLYNTNIRTAVIFMVDRNLNFNTFVFEGAEFEHHQERFVRRFDEYCLKFGNST